MDKQTIKNWIGDTSELFTSTAELLDKTALILEDEVYNDQEGKQIIDTIYQVLGENGDKMQKYLIHCVCSELNKRSLDPMKIEKWYDALIKE